MVGKYSVRRSFKFCSLLCYLCHAETLQRGCGESDGRGYKGAKLCTYHHWFGRPNKVHCEPYYELPMSITRLRALVQFWFGSRSLPVEQGRFVRPSVPRHLRRCDLCNTQAVGDELHYIFDCPCFGARAQYSSLFQDAGGSMRLFIWHEDQKAVSHCLTAILQMAQT